MTILTALRPRQDPSLPVDPSIPLPSIPIPTGTNDGTPGGDAPTDTGTPEPSGSPSPGPTQSSETPSVTEPPPSSTQ
ncbi:hypothetical protein AX16_003414 [Volvariella volvacea WC 439]|nr:hypothetical protein AX16_003414 [Volvariella volvacea WC 439]